MSNKEFTSKTYDSDGGESSMARNPLELIPPLPKEIMLQWWHKVHVKEKGKTMLSFAWILSWYTLKEWAQKVVKIDESLKVQSTLLGTNANPSTTAHVVRNCGETNLN